jgi:hypothetical protein
MAFLGFVRNFKKTRALWMMCVLHFWNSYQVWFTLLLDKNLKLEIRSNHIFLLHNSYPSSWDKVDLNKTNNGYVSLQ